MWPFTKKKPADLTEQEREEQEQLEEDDFVAMLEDEEE